ncbi:hypothetical protein RJ641_024286, partial [Dillenia turbinata]
MERKWEDMEMDCLVKVFEKLEIDDLTLGVPFVCKSWYKATLSSQCWKTLDFSKLNFGPFGPFARRFNLEYHIDIFSVTGLLKFALNRGRRSVLELLLPSTGTIEDLIYTADECPCLKSLGLPVMLLKEMPLTILKDEDMSQFLGLFAKWRDLEYVHVREAHSYTKELYHQISLHCKKFDGIKKRGLMDDEEALAIVNFLPTLKHLTVTSAFLTRKNLVTILQGCKGLEELVIKDCCGFLVDDEILKMTTHLKFFEYEDVRLDADE